MTLTQQQIKRAQARLAVVEHLLTNLGNLYELIATGAVRDSEILSVFSSVVADEKQDILRLLTDLSNPGADTPLDEASASQGRLRTEQAKAVLSHLNRTLAALLSPLHTNEEGATIADMTTEQRDALVADITRAVAKLRQTIAAA